MKSRENIIDMYKHFSNLVNDLQELGKRIETTKLVKKILRSLLDSWTMKIMTIKESKDLSKIGMDELIRSLFTHEMKRKLKKEEVKTKKDIALKVVDKKEKEENSFMDEDDMSLLARKFSKFLSR